MIHHALKDILEKECPDLNWSVRYFMDEDNTGTVYYEGGKDPHRFDPDMYYPSYGVLIRSSDWRKAEEYALRVSEALHKRRNEYMEGYRYQNGKMVLGEGYAVLSIDQVGDVLDLGIVNNEINEWKINFETRLYKLKEGEK